VHRRDVYTGGGPSSLSNPVFVKQVKATSVEIPETKQRNKLKKIFYT
jgi:hypothetical protein